MARNFYLNGESMVFVKFGQHIPSTICNIPGIPGDTNKCELGLTSDQIRISPKYYREDLKTDDFGPNVPANLIQYAGEVSIGMTLIHFDPEVLEIVEAESTGGAVLAANATIIGQDPGILQPAGTLLGYGNPFASGNHFISMSIVSPNIGFPYRFLTSTLADSPEVRPLGTEKSQVSLTWRAIPYRPPSPTTGEVFSSGTVLWDRQEDT